MERKSSTKINRLGRESRLVEKRLLDRLTPDEANAVLHGLMKKHPGLQPEAEELARNIVSLPSIEEIADEVFHAVTSVDLDALNERAGSHSWGYVEPSEAAGELLEESLDPLINNMKRQAELGLAAGAEAICVGIVEGLYRSRNVNTDGALGWAPDFPAEEAGHVVGEFFRSSPPAANLAAGKPLYETLAARAPEWADLLRRGMNDCTKG